MLKLISAFSFKAKLTLLASYSLVLITGTLYVHNKFIDAAKLPVAEKQLDKAKAAPGAVIDKNQKLRASNVDKDPCASKPIPADALKLLR